MKSDIGKSLKVKTLVKSYTIVYLSMAIANLNKSEEMVTNTTTASKLQAKEGQNLYQWKSPLPDHTS